MMSCILTQFPIRLAILVGTLNTNIITITLFEIASANANGAMEDKMILLRGTTPRIVIRVKKPELDLHQLTQVWVYIYQRGLIRFNKTISDVSFDYDNRLIIVPLSQEDTLSLKSGEGIFQIRALMADGTALGIIEREIEIETVRKDGVITEEVSNG